jgi:intein-encoded DNA endonuclease-like protein
MAPKGNVDKVLKRFEDEKRREFILDLRAAGKSYGYIAGEVEKIFKVKISRATVQSVCQRFKNRISGVAKKSPGRPGKMTKQYVRKQAVCFAI